MEIETHAIVDLFVVQKKMYTRNLGKVGCNLQADKKGKNRSFFIDQNDEIDKMIRLF